MKEFRLSPPWEEFYNEMETLFAGDPGVRVVKEYDEDSKKIKVYCDDKEQEKALIALLPNKKTFGNITVEITVVPSNEEEETYADLFRTAFKNNKAFAFAYATTGAFAFPATYIAYAPEVVQYFSDSMDDVNGYTSTLYENIARDIFEIPGVYHCTDLLVKNEDAKVGDYLKE